MELLNYQPPASYPQELDLMRKMYEHDEPYYHQPPQQPVVYHPGAGHQYPVPMPQQPILVPQNPGPPPQPSQPQLFDQDDYLYPDQGYAFHAPPPAQPHSQQPLPGYAHLTAPLTLLLTLGPSHGPQPNHQPAQPSHQPPSNHNGSFDMGQYPDMTSLVNLNHNIVVPMVELTFVDHKVCNVCGKRITRDMLRHMRTHQAELRFSCKFPKNQCRHKLGKFNRPYDFKKHLLNRHFKFDNLLVKRLHNLSDKLNHWGTCPCGLRFMGKDWLNKHILTDDTLAKCPFIE